MRKFDSIVDTRSKKRISVFVHLIIPLLFDQMVFHFWHKHTLSPSPLIVMECHADMFR